MKRVYCLYRVSTAQQVDVVKDDIPMQRIACHDFAARMGWTILVEKEEKGISGFKVPKQVLLCTTDRFRRQPWQALTARPC